MTIDNLLFFLLMAVPYGWVVVKQDKLKDRKPFVTAVCISLAVLVLGVLYQKYSQTDKRFLVYIGSQMTFVFVILYKLIRIPFYRFFKREPEISAGGYAGYADFIPSLIVLIGSLVIPLLIDHFFFKRLLE